MKRQSHTKIISYQVRNPKEAKTNFFYLDLVLSNHIWLTYVVKNISPDYSFSFAIRKSLSTFLLELKKRKIDCELYVSKEELKKKKNSRKTALKAWGSVGGKPKKLPSYEEL